MINVKCDLHYYMMRLKFVSIIEFMRVLANTCLEKIFDCQVYGNGRLNIFGNSNAVGLACETKIDRKISVIVG